MSTVEPERDPAMPAFAMLAMFILSGSVLGPLLLITQQWVYAVIFFGMAVVATVVLWLVRTPPKNRRNAQLHDGAPLHDGPKFAR